jgi:hypothetical protein
MAAAARRAPAVARVMLRSRSSSTRRHNLCRATSAPGHERFAMRLSVLSFPILVLACSRAEHPPQEAGAPLPPLAEQLGSDAGVAPPVARAPSRTRTTVRSSPAPARSHDEGAQAPLPGEGAQAPLPGESAQALLPEEGAGPLPADQGAPAPLPADVATAPPLPEVPPVYDEPVVASAPPASPYLRSMSSSISSSRTAPGTTIRRTAGRSPPRRRTTCRTRTATGMTSRMA